MTIQNNPQTLLRAMGIETWCSKDAVTRVPLNKSPVTEKQQTLTKPVLILLSSIRPPKTPFTTKHLLKNILFFLQLKLEDCDILYMDEDLPDHHFSLGDAPKKILSFGKYALPGALLNRQCQIIETFNLIDIMTQPGLKKQLLMDIYGYKNTITDPR